MQKLSLLVVLLSSVLLTACAATSETRFGTADQVCRSWGTIWPSRKDKLTPGTERQIAGNNAAREPWCGKPKGPPKDEAPELKPKEPATVDADKAKRSA
jgi:hypothetical protein